MPPYFAPEELRMAGQSSHIYGVLSVSENTKLVTPSELSDRLHAVMQRAGLSKEEFAKEVGISRPTLRKALKGEELDLKRTGILLNYIECREAELMAQKKSK